MRRGSFLWLFAVSGAAALIYEVAWTRLLTLQMGHGIAAASTVLAAFMGGLAVGSALAGRVGGRLAPVTALRAYAALETGIGLVALLLPLGLMAVRPLLAATYNDGEGGVAFGLLRLGSSVFLLALPSAAMGASFPIAARWTVARAARAAGDAGLLYAANTIGAAAGAVLAGFVLLPALGLRGTTWVGVALNVIAAGGAWLLAASAERKGVGLADPLDEGSPAAPARVRKGKPAKAAAAEQAWMPRPAIAAAALGVSGFASLALQIVWTRLLALVLGPTTYAFSLIVAIFIVGIAGGAAIGSRAASARARVVPGLAACLLLTALFALGAALGIDRALVTIAEVVAHPAYTFGDVLLREVLLVCAILLPMTLGFGAAFPFGIALASGRDDSVTADLGRLYAINTAGAIAGALLTGFVLLPAIGLHASIQLVAVVLAIAAAAVLLAAGRRRPAWLGAAAVVIAAAVWLPHWDRLLLSSGAYKYAPSLRGPSLKTALSAGELLSYQEGATGTVAVRRLTGTTSLSIDGKVDASNAGDMLTQRLLAHVPLLLHPDPKRVAVLGLGSGVTLGSALTHPVTEAVVLEISPEVVDASRFFEAENHGALKDPRTRLVVGDGRTHLLLGREQYDVIISEPSNPWMAGIASLFTREFFEAARARLAPGGVLCQWAHTYDISSADLKSIVATFLSVFPEGTMWMVGDADVLLVGSTGPLTDRIAGMAAGWQRPGVAADLAGVAVGIPFDLLSSFVAEGPALAAWAAGAPLQTDDRAELEFSGPRSIFGPSPDDNAVTLRQLAASSPRPPAVAEALSGATSAEWQNRGAMLLRAEAFRPAFDDFARALTLAPADEVSLDGLLRAAAPSGRLGEARTVIGRLASDPLNAPAKLALSRLLASEGQVDEAIRIPVALLQANSGNVPALEQLASVLADAGDVERLAPVVARLSAEAPASPWSHYYAASLFFLQGRQDLALREARATVGLDPSNAKAHNLIGASLANMGRRDEARQAFLDSIAADPHEPGTYANLAALELESGNRDLARRYFSEALTVDPDWAAARQGLASIDARPIQ